MRERVAELLHRAGALGAMMGLRRLTPVPTLSIVTYHHVAPEDASYPYDPSIADATPEQFRRQLELLARYCTPIGIEELVRAIDGAPLPKNPVMVTFDDGYRSCHDVALPILRAVGVKATFFISTSFITERRLYWWERIALLVGRAKHQRASITYPEPLELDRRDAGLHARLTALVKNTPALDVDRFLDELCGSFGVEWNREIEADSANRLIMTWDQIRALARAGMDVESHGRRHRVLQTLDNAELTDELSASRTELESQIKRPVRALAYPVGRRIVRESRIRRAITAAGYRVGLSNSSGATRVSPMSLRKVLPLDPFDIHRLATDRRFSDAMFLTQIAVPPFAYIGSHNKF
jgi:peptidoglycan/xylan/chitin deacetylase (PgdA/CDA1 family)